MVDPIYEEMTGKFLEHFFWIAGSMDVPGDTSDELWDEEDGFFYDALRLPDGTGMRLRVRSLVGLLPLCATMVVDEAVFARFPRLVERIRSFVSRHRSLTANLPSIERPK
jgi:hypothetical protein